MKVYLGNLPKSLSEAQLKELVVPFGKVDSAEVAKDRATGESRGFGFVQFPNDDEARAAIAGLDGKEVSGQKLRVSEARPPKSAGKPPGGKR